MKRYWLVVAMVAGAAGGWLAKGNGRVEACPASQFTGDPTQEISVRRMSPPNSEVLVLRPCVLTDGGRTVQLAPLPSDESRRWQGSYGDGRVTVACELVERR